MFEDDFDELPCVVALLNSSQRTEAIEKGNQSAKLEGVAAFEGRVLTEEVW